jgi:hypothetical protein
MWRREDIEQPVVNEPAGLPPPWLAKWRTLDDEAEIARVHAELRVSLADWTRAMAKVPGARLAAVSFFYAGTEVAPYLPQDVWADGLAELKRDGDSLRRGARHFREYPAFALCVAGELLTELGEDDDFASSEIGEALSRALVLRSLVWLHGGLKRLRADPAFAALPTAPEFVFIASPGHDEPWGVVG